MRRVALLPLLACAGLAACSDALSPTAAARPTLARAQVTAIGASFTDLGLIPNMTESAAYGVNELGVVVGHSSVPNGAVSAFTWSPTTGMVPLVPTGAGWGNTYAFSINDGGQIAGVAINLVNQARAVVWEAGVMRELGVLPGGSYSVALGNNNSGYVVGYSRTTPTGTPHAVLYAPSGGMQDLGTLGGSESMAEAINDLGQVVGTAGMPNGVSYAFSWTAAGGMQALPMLKGAREANALGVNRLGDIVGYMVMKDNSTRAVVWPQPVPGKKGAYTDVIELGSLARGATSAATDINDSRTIVGYATDTRAGGSGQFIAVTWDQQARWKYNPTVLPMPAGVRVSYAQAINEGLNGAVQIAGITATAASTKRAGMWQ